MTISNPQPQTHPLRRLLILAFLAIPFMAGCFCFKTINSSEAGIQTDAGKVVKVLGPGGPHSELSPYVELNIINVSAQNVEWNDPDLTTSDVQPIGLTLNVTYSRTRDSAALEAMWSNYNLEAKDDNALRTQVLAKIPGAAKTATSMFTLLQMIGVEPLRKAQENPARQSQVVEIAGKIGVDATQLNTTGRDLLATVVEILLRRELAEVGVVINAVTIVNAAPSAEYQQLLEDAANARQERITVIEQRKTTNEQLETERLNTQIQLEIADRDVQIREKAAQIFTNPVLVEIELARIWAEAINKGDAVIFVPAGTNLSSVLSQTGINSGVLPILANQSGELIPLTEDATLTPTPAGQ